MFFRNNRYNAWFSFFTFFKMKLKLLPWFFVWIVLPLILVSCTGTIKDSDGNRYNILRIGNQVWMGENLNVSTFRNGDSIPEAKSAEEWIRLGSEGKPAWCSLENDSTNVVKYGRLYNWYAVNDPRGLAPKGWHIASDDDWTYLINNLGGGVIAASRMRVTTMESENNRDIQFAGLAAGARALDGTFYGIASHGYWWTSTAQSETSAWIRMLNYEKCDILFLIYNKGIGLSVRCVKD